MSNSTFSIISAPKKDTVFNYRFKIGDTFVLKGLDNYLIECVSGRWQDLKFVLREKKTFLGVWDRYVSTGAEHQTGYIRYFESHSHFCSMLRVLFNKIDIAITYDGEGNFYLLERAKR